MNLDSVLEAPLAVQIHLGLAVLAVFIGPVAIYRRQRDWVHKVAGYCWVSVMALVAASSFFIQGLEVIGPFSPIHLLSVYVLIGLVQGVLAARAREISAHQSHMQNLYWFGIGVAGLLTLWPGRRLNELLFAGAPEMGFAAIGIGLLILAVFRWRARGEKNSLLS